MMCKEKNAIFLGDIVRTHYRNKLRLYKSPFDRVYICFTAIYQSSRTYVENIKQTIITLRNQLFI